MLIAHLAVATAHLSPLTWVQAIVIGTVQGIAEMFPISSLGHTVLVPGWLGWHNLVRLSSPTATSFYLAFVVGLHVATAFALLCHLLRVPGETIGGLRLIRNRSD